MRFATTGSRRVWFNPPPVPADERDAFIHIPGTDRAAGPKAAAVEARVR
jgi:hypothetical protein